jgi:hypothetical protein
MSECIDSISAIRYIVGTYSKHIMLTGSAVQVFHRMRENCVKAEKFRKKNESVKNVRSFTFPSV